MEVESVTRPPILKLLRQLPQLVTLDAVNLTLLEWNWDERTPFFGLELLYLICNGQHKLFGKYPVVDRNLVLYSGLWGGNGTYYDGALDDEPPSYSEVLKALKQRMTFKTTQDPCFLVAKWPRRNRSQNSNPQGTEYPHWQISAATGGWDSSPRSLLLSSLLLLGVDHHRDDSETSCSMGITNVGLKPAQEEEIEVRKRDSIATYCDRTHNRSCDPSSAE
ncbi:hypothetical protein DL96DRAFT_1684752 [Flagelloscypha sp. PMI_526]|nr:hypothetical protein DL96DRAFT_1684752 [Flagelloscypha sp. PMI_526]